MPNVGWGELIVVALVALIVFGPNKLPEMMRSMGKALRGFQEASSGAMDQLRAATEPPPDDSEHGVIDSPDGHVEPQPEEIVLYNRNPSGEVPEEKPKSRAHTPRKRTTTTAKKAAPRSGKTTKRSTSTAKKAAPKRTPNGRAKSPRQAHEDT
jgi:sec-independent protein translocase protein TatA